MDTIGVVCEPDHPVFGRVAERLAARGFGVEFFPPQVPVDRGRVGELDALVNTVVSRRSLGVLRYADRAGVETWNGFVPTTALACRLVGRHALETLGCLVPRSGPSPADEGGNGDVRMDRFRWDDAPGDDYYEAPVARDPTRTRYYAVDDGVETHVQAVTVRSRLPGQDPAAAADGDVHSTVTAADVDVQLATRVRELLAGFGARAVAVDFVEAADGPYAVDVDPTPEFFAVGMERRVADSMASLTTIGA